ncbi:MAG TPA: hypothetical protein VFO85_08910 [Vicinamibacteria bacterium]|nr:hypothetical protein [Vicinamibacteria bacterium]
MIPASALVPGGDIYDASPQPGDEPHDSWARALFAAHAAFHVAPWLRPECGSVVAVLDGVEARCFLPDRHEGGCHAVMGWRP